MKYRVGACAAILALAGCSSESPDNNLASLRGAASSSTAFANGLASLPAVRSTGKSIASAADRGALVSYANQGKPTHQEGALTWYPVEVSEDHAMKALVTGEMTLPAPDGSQLKLRYERHKEQVEGNWTWVGRLEGGDPAQEAIITFGQDAVFGSIPQKDGTTLNLETRNGKLWIVATDPSKVVRPTSEHGDTMVASAQELRRSVEASLPQAQQVQQAQVMQSAVPMAAAPPTSANTIDVAIGYTPEFAVNGDSWATSRLVQLLEVGNQAFSNSQINGYLRLVKTVRLNYTNNSANSEALQQLTGSTGSASVPVPAGLAPLRTARDEFGADVAILVRKYSYSTHNGCGIAWLNGANLQEIIPAQDAGFGYAVVSDGSETIGNQTYVCGDTTLVHEVGHLAGSAHDRANAPEPGRYEYSYGYKTDSANGNFYTIMAYGGNNQVAYRYFSNPNITLCGGLRCGVANSEDNARSLNQTIPVVAQFKATIVPFDGIANLHVIKRQGASGFTEIHTLTGYSNYQNYSRNLATALASSGVDASWAFQFADYNGDGTLDLYAIKKVGSSGKTEVHVLNGAGGFKSFLLNAATALASAGTNSRWEFKVADYNRDGKPDVYAIDRTGASGKTEVHVLNGSDGFKTYLLHSASALGATGTNDSWKFELGDYDGNGSPDLYAIKKNGSSGKTEVHVLNGTGGFKAFLLQKATILGSSGNDNAWDYKLADYDLNGKLDLFAIKKNGSAGKTEVHVLNGTNQFQSFLFQKATALPASGNNHAWEFVVNK